MTKSFEALVLPVALFMVIAMFASAMLGSTSFSLAAGHECEPGAQVKRITSGGCWN